MAQKKATKNKDYVYVVTVDTDGKSHLLGTFQEKERAERVAFIAAREILPDIYCEHAYLSSSDSEECWGDWDDLPETEAERTEDDDYSKEGVLELIRKAGGQVRIETPHEDEYFETTISQQKVK
jgi:hypothetical protein